MQIETTGSSQEHQTHRPRTSAEEADELRRLENELSALESEMQNWVEVGYGDDICWLRSDTITMIQRDPKSSNGSLINGRIPSIWPPEMLAQILGFQPPQKREISDTPE